MELYEAIAKRRTIRDFTTEPVPDEILRRILAAGLKAPSHDHAREWHYVIARDQRRIGEILQLVSGGADFQKEKVRKWAEATDCQRDMYDDALPKQVRMLAQSGCLILPLFSAGPDFLHPAEISSLNNFASIWCLIQNILLAATAEGLGCTLRIPIRAEEEYVLQVIGAPEGYRLPCYLAIGYPAADAKVLEQVEANLAERIHCSRW